MGIFGHDSYLVGCDEAPILIEFDGRFMGAGAPGLFV